MAKIVSLDDVCTAQSSSIAQKDLTENSGEYPIYGASGFIKNVDFYKQDKPYLAIVKDGAGVGRVLLLPEYSSVIGTMQYILPKDNVDINFLYYVLTKLNLARYFSGATIPHIYFKDYKKERISLPSLAEQRKIASVLDKVSDLISKRRKQLDKLDELVKARFVEMFGDITTNPFMWKKEYMQEHIDILTGYPFESNCYSDKGIKICGGLIIMPSEIKWDECKNWSSVDGYEKFLLKADDIVVALDRPWISEGFKIGMIRDNDLPALLIQRTARIRGKDMESQFLYYLLKNEAFERQCTITGSLVPHISNKDINNYEVIVPPINLQKQFSDFAKQVDNFKSTLKQSLSQLELLKKSLMQEYFG